MSAAPPPLLFHYTTYAGFLGVLESRALWASCVRQLNDAREYQHTFDLLHNRILVMPRRASGAYSRLFLTPYREALAATPARDAYVACFSGGGDELGLWRAYSGRGAGIAMGFATSELIAMRQTTGFALRPCIYCVKDQLRALRNLHVKCMSQEGDEGPRIMVDEIAEMAAVFKHWSFTEEREWRLVGSAIAAGATRFRAGPGMIVPYVVLPLPLGSAHVLKEIVVGPSPYASDVCAAVELALTSNGVDSCRVIASASPYRSL